MVTVNTLIIKLFLEISMKRNRAFLRAVMRGYRLLKNSGKLNRIWLLKDELTTCNLGINLKNFSTHIFGNEGVKFSEIIVRQYLLNRFCGLELNKALLYSVSKGNGKVIYPLPKIWRQIINSHDFEVSSFWCALLWQLKVFLYFGFGVVRIFKISFQGFISKNSSENYCQYIYFDRLTESNLPSPDGNGKNIFSWYSQWPGRKEDIQKYRHSVKTPDNPLAINDIKIEFQDSPIPGLVGIASRFKYLRWGLLASVIAFIDMFRGRWWHAILLNQAAMMGQVVHIKSNLLAREYLFHNSGWIYRPLWTYEAESRGSAISFYFYSTNCEHFQKFNKKASVYYGFRAMSWPRYLVWDMRQAEFIKEVVGTEANISPVGEIWFLNGSQLNSLMPKNSIAVFDVQPVRDSFYYTLGLETEYYTPNIAIAFLSDVAYSISNNNKTFVLKIKRQIGKLAHPKYRYFLQKLDSSNDFINIDPSVSAGDIIANSSAVISMPFTATALLGRAAGKPSIYYDPEGLIQKNDPAAHGIPILSGKLELEIWVRGLSESETN